MKYDPKYDPIPLLWQIILNCLALVLCAGLMVFFAGKALAHPFDTVNYECKQLDPVKDGVKCLVRYEGKVPVLYVSMLYSAKSPKEKRERMGYVFNVTQRNFGALGGSAITRRFTLDGIPAQQNCSTAPRGRFRCWNPERVSDLKDPLPWPF